MDLDKIKQLMAFLETSKLKKIVYKQGDFELHLEKEDEAPLTSSPAPVVHTVASRHPHHLADQPHPQKPEKPPEAVGKFVTSPMVGTFYAAPGPGQPSFVKVGDRVEEKTVVCIIEAMKVMNEVKAGVAGTVAEICMDAGQPVEFGTRLFRIT